MHDRQIRLRDHLNSTSHKSARAVEHNDGVTGADPGVGIQGTHPPSPVVILRSCSSDLPFVQRIHKISDDLAIISMISDKRTMILPWYRYPSCDAENGRDQSFAYA